MNHDYAALALSLFALAGLVGFAELLHRKLHWPSRASRRLVHAGTGLFVVAIPYLFTGAATVYLLGAVFVLVNGCTSAKGWLPGLHPVERKSWGTVAFPLALLAILPFCWGTERQFILQTSFLVLAIADPLAATIGEASSGRQVRIGSGTKSLAGSMTFFVAAWLLTLAGLVLFGPSTEASVMSGRTLLLSGVVALVATAVEALGGRGWDNFFIVVAITAVLVIWHLHPGWLTAMAIGGGLGVVFGVTSWRMEYLTLSGAIAGGLFAATLVGIGGWGWMAPGFAFFFLSSALSKWAPESKGTYAEESVRESRRNASQVYANGGMAWLLVIIYALEPHDLLYWGFVGSLAAATADTWATEVGPLLRQQPRMILSGRPVPAGTSGAVSWGGTLAGVVGAVVIWAVAWWTAPDPVRVAGVHVSLISTVGGAVLGSMVDSLAGAMVQAVYREEQTGRIVDTIAEPETASRRLRGWARVDNNVVNALCTGVGAGVAMLLVLTMK